MSKWHVVGYGTGLGSANGLTQSEKIAATKLGYPTLTSEFDLGTPLGKGGNGVVRKGKHKKSGLTYAVKAVAKVPSMEEWRERNPGGQPMLIKDLKKNVDGIKNEIDVLRKLSGSLNVVDFYGAYEDDEHVYFVMELCTGGEILHDIGKGAIYNEEVVRAPAHPFEARGRSPAQQRPPVLCTVTSHSHDCWR